jgi:superfamily II DNA or RNA helicase
LTTWKKDFLISAKKLALMFIIIMKLKKFQDKIFDDMFENEMIDLYTVINRKRQKMIRNNIRGAKFLPRMINLFVKEKEEYHFPPGIMRYSKEGDPVKSGDMNIRFIGKLRDHQEELVQNTLKKNVFCGMLVSPTGSGKTACLCYLLSEFKDSTLILVKNKALMYQMKEAIEKFTDRSDICMWGDGKKEMGKITIVTQASWLQDPEMFNNFSVIFIDECDCFVGDKSLKALCKMEAERVFAFTATPYTDAFDSDYLERIFGPMTKSSYENLIPEICVFEYTSTEVGPCQDWHEKRIKHCDENEHRLKKHVSLLKAMGEKYKHSLALYDRIDTLDYMSQHLDCFVIKGEVKKKERDEIIEEYKKNGGVLIATESTIGRGFDCPEIKCVALLFPNKFSGRVKQMVGRALRQHDGKGTPIIIDWCDTRFRRQFRERLSAYEELWGADIKIKYIPV